jgi:uncharacterized membrane-anchored protein YitT (DUF2179 family)
MHKDKLKNIAFIILGCTVLSIGVQSFDNPNLLVTGGLSGLGIIIENTAQNVIGINIPLWLTNILLNAPLFLGAWYVMGKKFFYNTLFTSAFFSFSLYYCDFLPKYQGDMVLVSIFGGMFVGTGAGMVLRAMSSTGGTDLAAALLHKMKPHISVSKGIFVLDAVIILLGVATFGLEKAMYAVISIFVSSRCIGMILEGLSFSKAAFIISDYSDEISVALLHEAERGVTAFLGKGMYTKSDKEILLCVFSQKEITLVKSIIMNIDRNAFLLLMDVKEVLGEGFQKIEKEK